MKTIQTKEEFDQFVEDFFTTHAKPYAFAIGNAFRDDDGNIVAVRWLKVNIETSYGFFASCINCMAPVPDFSGPTLLSVSGRTAQNILDRALHPFRGESGHDNMTVLSSVRDVNNERDGVMIVYPNKEYLTDKAPVSSADVLCRLTMISTLHFQPRVLNLDGAFGLLNRLYYTEDGAMTEAQWKKQFLLGKVVQPISVDKFPPMWWGAPIPEGVRIADLSRVRLGAHLAPGTTVMHAGFVNFNAGTLGASMVEGRISASVIVGNDSDIGGGASIMGTLSGGGKEVITIGKNCLLGANSGTGISLGDRCTVEAGLYVKSGMLIKVASLRFEGLETQSIPGQEGMWIKAEKLSGKSDMLFIRNSVTGSVELRWNKKPNKLNPDLH